MARTYESQCYCTNLRRSAGAVADFYDASLQPSGLTTAQFSLLRNLKQLGQANITHWAEHVGLERSTLVRNLRPLQERGLIEAAEGHGKTYRLSGDGEAALRMAVPLWEQAQKHMQAFLGEDAQSILRIGQKLQNLSI